MCRLEYGNASLREESFETTMKVHRMSEPISGTAAGIFSWKLIGGLVGITGAGAAIATYFVMNMTKPETNKEWHMAISSTVVGSIFGGSALVRYLEIQHWFNDPMGAMGLIGLCFACGLPAWLLVRGLFKFMNKNKDKDIGELYKDVKDIL
jgi:magnesium-transporting ATPase (P-type)